MTKWISWVAVLAVSNTAAYALVPSFQGLGDLDGGDFMSVANDVSADGSTVETYFRYSSYQGHLAALKTGIYS